MKFNLQKLEAVNEHYSTMSRKNLQQVCNLRELEAKGEITTKSRAQTVYVNYS